MISKVFFGINVLKIHKMGIDYIFIGAFYVETEDEEVYDTVQHFVNESYDGGGWISDEGSTIEMDPKNPVRKNVAEASLKEILKEILKSSKEAGAVISGTVGVCSSDDPTDYSVFVVKNGVLSVRKAKFTAPKAKKVAKKAVVKKAKAKKVSKKAKTKAKVVAK